jgi:hypothetical protein
MLAKCWLFNIKAGGTHSYHSVQKVDAFIPIALPHGVHCISYLPLFTYKPEYFFVVLHSYSSIL